MKKLLLILCMVPMCSHAFTFRNLSPVPLIVMVDSEYIGPFEQGEIAGIPIPQGERVEIGTGPYTVVNASNWGVAYWNLTLTANAEMRNDWQIYLDEGLDPEPDPDPATLTNWEALNLGVLCAVPVCGWLLGCWVFRRGLGVGNGALGED